MVRIDKLFLTEFERVRLTDDEPYLFFMRMHFDGPLNTDNYLFMREFLKQTAAYRSFCFRKILILIQTKPLLFGNLNRGHTHLNIIFVVKVISRDGVNQASSRDLNRLLTRNFVFLPFACEINTAIIPMINLRGCTIKLFCHLRLKYRIPLK